MVARKVVLLVCAAMVLICSGYPAMAMDPLDGKDAKADVDRDGLNSAQEFLYGTDPNDPDSDEAGAYDGWEMWYEEHRATYKATGEARISGSYHFDPNFAGDEGLIAFPGNMIQVRDPDANMDVNDPDNDGWNNLHEFLIGTDPTNPNTDADMYAIDSADPDPLVSNGGYEDEYGDAFGPGFDHNCVQDDHPSEHQEDGEIGNSSVGPGNGGGGSGEAWKMA